MDKMKNKTKVCCICGEKYMGWGNNPWPIVDSPNAMCCDLCNSLVVVPARLKRMLAKEGAK